MLPGMFTELILQLYSPYPPLSYVNLLGIIILMLRGLEYLHEHCNPPVVHRDVKSSSILLDSNFSAKVRSNPLMFNLERVSSSNDFLPQFSFQILDLL